MEMDGWMEGGREGRTDGWMSETHTHTHTLSLLSLFFSLSLSLPCTTCVYGLFVCAHIQTTMRLSFTNRDRYRDFLEIVLPVLECNQGKVHHDPEPRTLKCPKA